MKVTAIETGSVYTIELRTWEGLQYGPDMFDDLEDNFLQVSCRYDPDTGTYSCEERTIKELIDFWAAEAEKTNRYRQYWNTDENGRSDGPYYVLRDESGDVYGWWGGVLQPQEGEDALFVLLWDVDTV